MQIPSLLVVLMQVLTPALLEWMWKAMKNRLDKGRIWLRIAFLMIPLAYIASMAGWLVAEVGRQPWVIQDLMPTMTAVSRIDSGAVQITFWMFAAIFSILLIAELSIMIKQIKIGPKEEEA